MSAVATKVPVARIRKLLRLATSPEPHEAARAAEQARALMERHGVTIDDVAEHILQVVDTERDAYREFLAHMAASLAHCAVAFHRLDGIAFKGMPSKVHRAAKFYRSAIEESRAACLPPVASWFQADALNVWHFYWWDGFASAVYARFGKPNPADRVQDSEPAAAASVVVEPVEASESPIPQVQASARELFNHVDTNWLKAEALKAGKAAGTRVQLETTTKRLVDGV